MELNVVELKLPDGSKAIAEWARDLAERAEAGEIERIFYLIVRPDGVYATGEKGSPTDSLRVIGELEAMKLDILEARTIDKPE